MNKNIIFFIIVILILLLASNINGASVISDKSINNKYTIDCLGTDNEIFIYNEENDLNYRRSCDGAKSIQAEIIENGEYLEIRNGEDNEDFLYYKEIFNKIDALDFDFLQTDFNDNICFELKTKSYSDIRVLDVEKKQVKTFYNCFNKNDIQEETINIYIDEQLKKEITYKKNKDITINIKTFHLINKDFENLVNVEFSNPNNDLLKVQVVDTNLGCGKKTFTLSDRYIMTCNVTSRNVDDIILYYIQIKTDKGDFYFKEYKKPILPNTDAGVNWFVFLIIAGVIVALIIYYNSNVSNREKKAIDSLENDNEN